MVMNKLLIPSILAATILIAGIFAFMPVNKASTVHVTLEEQLGDRWISGNLFDVRTADTDFNLSEESDEAQFNIEGGYLFIDISGTGTVTLYCDQNNNDADDAGEDLAELAADGVDQLDAPEIPFEPCNFLRLEVSGTDGAGETVDVYYLVQVTGDV